MNGWRNKRRALLVAVFVSTLIFAGAASGHHAENRNHALGGVSNAAGKHASRGLLVKFVTPAQGAARVAAAGDVDLGKTRTRVDVVRIDEGESLDAKLAAYRGRSDVVYAEPNYRAFATDMSSPDDPAYEAQWSLSKAQAVSGWSLFPGSYDIRGNATIAIVDTGVDLTHPDLAAQLDTADAANCVGDESGMCAPGSALDDQGHGTHTTGIAAATANNGVGVAGVAFSSRVMPVKVLDGAGGGSYASVANGILWAAEHGSRVISLSLGGYGYSQTICDAVAIATNTYGSLVVAAAGNDGRSEPVYPAACPGAIGVAATDGEDRAAPWSNYGAPDVFVSAPGVDILSTYPPSSYDVLSGTSMATPAVAGLAALLFDQDPTRTPGQVKEILARSADKVGGVDYGADPYHTCSGCSFHPRFGYGRINIGRALGGPDFTLAASPARRTVRRGGNTSYSVVVTGGGGFQGEATLAANGLPRGSSWAFSDDPMTHVSVLRIHVPTRIARGTYRFAVSGTGGGMTRSVELGLKVTR